MTDIVSWHVAFYLLAVHFYLYDMKQGTIIRKVRIFLHNITTSDEENIKGPINKGIIYGRRTKRKVFMAVVFSGVLSFIFMFFPHSIPIPIEVILFFTKSTIVYIGFVSAFLFEKLYAFISSLFKTVDKIESGELDVEKEVGDAVNSAVDKVQKSLEKGFKNEKIAEKPKEVQSEETNEANIEQNPGNNEKHDNQYYANKLKNFGK